MAGQASSGWHGARTNAAHSTLVSLNCGCVLTFSGTHAPKNGEMLWCPRHERMELQVLDTFITKCDDCNYARHYGGDIRTAQGQAMAHCLRTRTHNVKVRQGRKIVSEHGPSSRQLTIEAEEPPPF